MANIIDLTGMRFGRWTVLEKGEIIKYSCGKSGRMWKCKCDCGTVKQVNGQTLRRGESQSCGCLHYEQFGEQSRTHGKSKTRLYHVWSSMRRRCLSPTHHAYAEYGGRGIKICSDWDSFSEFEKWALATGYKSDAKKYECTLDRVDVDGDYCPENCRWTNQYVQANNTRRNVYITFKGITKTRAEWARDIGCRYELLRDRLDRYHWSIERALTEPVRKW